MTTENAKVPQKKWSLLKKVCVFVFAPMAFGIAIIAMIPLFYSVDHLRPQIESAINQKIQGKVSLGKISLKTLPSLGISIDSLTATPAAPFDQNPLISGAKAEVTIPFASLLGSPRLNISVLNPKIHLISKGTEGSLPSFLPRTPEGAPPTTDQTTNPTSSSGSESTGTTSVDDSLAGLPPWIRNKVTQAKINLEIEKAHIINEDLGPEGSKVELSNFGFSLSNVGLSSPIALKISGEIKLNKDTLVVSGPFQSSGTFQVDPQGKENKVSFNLENNLKDLSIKMSDLFKKEAGTDLTLGLEGIALQGKVIKADLSKFALQLASIAISGNAKYQSALDQDPGSILLNLSVAKIDLGNLAALVPMVKTYKLDGDTSLDIKVAGTPPKPTFDVTVDLKDIKGSTPQLQHPISQLKGRIRVVGTPEYPQVTIDPLSLKIASSDLSLKVKTAGISAPKVDLVLNSNSLNVDEIMGVEAAPKNASNKVASKTSGQQSPPAEEAPSTEPLDESLDKMAPVLEEALKNPMLDKAVANLNLQIQNMKMTGAKYKNVTLDLSYAKRNLSLKKAGLGAYKGELMMTGDFGLDPAKPTYNINAQAKGLNLGDAIALHAPAWKNDMSGLLFGTFSLSGAGIRKEQLNKNLSGGLKGDIKSGKISIPMIKLLAGVIESLPSGIGKNVKIPKDKKFNGEFKTCTLTTQIKGRNIQISNIDINYDTLELGIGEVLFKATGNVNFDRQVNLEGTAFLDKKAIPLAGIEGPSGKAEIPVKFSGPMSDPKMDYAYTAKILGPRLAKGELKKHETKIKETAIKAIQKKAPKELKGKLEDLTKKFKF